MEIPRRKDATESYVYQQQINISQFEIRVLLALFPSSILLCAITTGDVITQKHAVKTIHATKTIVTSPSNEIVIV